VITHKIIPKAKNTKQILMYELSLLKMRLLILMDSNNRMHSPLDKMKVKMNLKASK
jgi:hypothetical protein